MCGAAALVPRRRKKAVGGFDELSEHLCSAAEAEGKDQIFKSNGPRTAPS
jgi:hypothetical protein